jgi:hypothetical protein
MGNSATEYGELVCWSAFQADVVLFWFVHTAQPEFFKHGRKSQARRVLQLGHSRQLDYRGSQSGWSGTRVGIQQVSIPFADLLQNYSKAVLMGVEAPKAGSTESLGGRSQSASREVNARSHFLETEQRSMQRVCSEVEYPKLKYSVGRGPHKLRPAACFGPLKYDAAECKVKRGITVRVDGKLWYPVGA